MSYSFEEKYNKLVYNEENSLKSEVRCLSENNKVSNEEFIRTLKALYPYVKEDGILHPAEFQTVDLVEKVDSFYCNFGINKDGKFFLSSKTSGEVTEENFEENFKNNVDFLESFKFLKDYKLLFVVLKNISKELEKPIKFEAELLPLLTHQSDESNDVVFSATKYSKDRLGEKGAFVIFKAFVFENDIWKKPSPNIQKKIISDIMDADSKEWKLFTNNVHMKITQDIKIGDDINKLEKYFSDEEGFKELNELLNSKMTPHKKKILELINTIKNNIQKELEGISNSTLSNLGNDIVEGIIIRVKEEDGNVIEIKVNSNKFKSNKETLFKYRKQLETIVDDLKKDIKTKILHLKLTSDRAINKIFIDSLENFKANSENDEEAKQEYIISSISKLIDSQADFSNVRKEAKHLVSEYKNKLNQLKSEFKNDINNFDVNSLNKTKKSFGEVKEKIEPLFSILLDENDNDLKYILGVWKQISDNSTKEILSLVKPKEIIQQPSELENRLKNQIKEMFIKKGVEQ